MSQEYELPPARIRSAYEAYLDYGGTDSHLAALALQQDMLEITPGKIVAYWKPGDIFKTIVSLDEIGKISPPLRVRTLKLGPENYRFGHTIEELEALAVLHGVYKGG